MAFIFDINANDMRYHNQFWFKIFQQLASKRGCKKVNPMLKYLLNVPN